MISSSRMGKEGNRQAYPCRMFVAGEAPVARRTTGSATRPVVAAAKAKTEAESKNREVVEREGAADSS